MTPNSWFNPRGLLLFTAAHCCSTTTLPFSIYGYRTLCVHLDTPPPRTPSHMLLCHTRIFLRRARALSLSLSLSLARALSLSHAKPVPLAPPEACLASRTNSSYIYIYVCIYIHTYIHTYMHTHTHTYIHAYIHTYLNTYIHSFIHTNIL